MAEVELAVGFARVPLVDADELAVPRVEGEEAARCVAPLEDNVVPAGLLQEIGCLQARGPGPDDAVVVVEGSGAAGHAQAAGAQGQPQERPTDRWGHGGARAATPAEERTRDTSAGASSPDRQRPGHKSPPARFSPAHTLRRPGSHDAGGCWGGGVGAGPRSPPANRKRGPRSSSQWAHSVGPAGGKAGQHLWAHGHKPSQHLRAPRANGKERRKPISQ